MTLSLPRLTRHSFVFSLFLCKETLKPCKETLRTYLSIAHRSGFVFVWSMDLLCPSKPKRLLTEARYCLIANIPAGTNTTKQTWKKNRFRCYTFTLLSARYVTCIKDAQGLRISTCEQKIKLWPARVPSRSRSAFHAQAIQDSVPAQFLSIGFWITAVFSGEVLI